MLVFSLSHLTNIYDILITSYRPVCRPLARRTLPANALFLYARFAHYRCDEAWLEELIERAVERIEQGVYVCLFSINCGAGRLYVRIGKHGRSCLSRFLGLQYDGLSPSLAI